MTDYGSLRQAQRPARFDVTSGKFQTSRKLPSDPSMTVATFRLEAVPSLSKRRGQASPKSPKLINIPPIGKAGEGQIPEAQRSARFDVTSRKLSSGRE